MFTGLVEATGSVISQKAVDGGICMTFSHNFEGLSLGDSIAINGCCLTVIAFDDHSFSAELSQETLQLTVLGKLEAGSQVNLERALQAGARLGGHLVSGHVDGIGSISALKPEGGMTRVDVQLPAELARYVAKKGSLTVDGVSLTVNEVDKSSASLLIIPHTQSVTTLGNLKIGSLVNLEIDLVARYVERLLNFEPNSGNFLAKS